MKQTHTHTHMQRTCVNFISGFGIDSGKSDIFATIKKWTSAKYKFKTLKP